MRARRNTNVLIAGFLLFQLLYPIRSFVTDKFDAWGEFTWNMYSQTYECWSRYRLVEPSGAEQNLNLQKYFVLPNEIARVLNRQNLPEFHEFLCQQLAGGAKPGRILAQLSCTKNKLETQSLVRQNVDICTAPNHAVSLE